MTSNGPYIARLKTHTLPSKFGAVIIGGGFYGCSVALALAARIPDVALFEREPRLLARASYHNQARVHAGYHYPRNLLTALRSAANYSRFTADFGDCVETGATHYYAIAHGLSKVSSYQFKQFCANVGIPLKPAPPEFTRFFNPDWIDSVFAVQETAFNADALRDRLAAALARAGVHVFCGRSVESFAPLPDGLRITLDPAEEISASYAFNCTYSSSNQVLARSGLAPLPLKHELAELALIEVPPELEKTAITVMDGPFFSVVPFPALGVHTLSHVTYTPHAAWTDSESSAPRKSNPVSKSIFMLRDAERYMPVLRQSKVVGALFETKTVLQRNEFDDGRPILCFRHPEIPRLFSVLGSKLDNVYDVVRAIEAEIFPQAVAV